MVVMQLSRMKHLGFVNFTMSMMDEGTEKYNALEFDEKESSLGAGIVWIIT